MVHSIYIYVKRANVFDLIDCVNLVLSLVVLLLSGKVMVQKWLTNTIFGDI